MITTFVRGLAAAMGAIVVSACVSDGPSASSDFLAERDAARRYMVSTVSEQASETAIGDIRQAGSDGDRVLVDRYLADPAHARQLPARYQDYLIEVFDVDEIVAMTAWDGDPVAFEQQVDAHRFVIAQSLFEWHIGDAELDPSNVFDDHLINTLAAVIRATPGPLIPQSRLSAAPGE